MGLFLFILSPVSPCHYWYQNRSRDFFQNQNVRIYKSEMCLSSCRLILQGHFLLLYIELNKRHTAQQLPLWHILLKDWLHFLTFVSDINIQKRITRDHLELDREQVFNERFSEWLPNNFILCWCECKLVGPFEEAILHSMIWFINSIWASIIRK